MSVYVDRLRDWGWMLRGRRVPNCHMIADTLEELHGAAAAIGLRREWFQESHGGHYDLVPSKRLAAVSLGAIEIDDHRFVEKIRENTTP